MQNGLIDAFRWVRLRLGKLLVTGASLSVVWAAVVAPARADPLPVLLSGMGDWFDGTNAAQQLNLIFPVENQPGILQKSWSHGGKPLLSEGVYGYAVLLLSNVWTSGATNLSQGDFLKAHGVTNAPLVLEVPGESGYYLLVANNRVLPFVGREGRRTPEAMWALPTLPVKLEGAVLRNADISVCGRVTVQGERLGITGWLGRRGRERQSWLLRDEGGLLQLEVHIGVSGD